MSKIKQYISKKITETNHKIDISSYTLFKPVTDYIIEETNYSDYSNIYSDTPSRFYISRIPFETLLFSISLTIFILLFYSLVNFGLFGLTEHIQNILRNANIIYIFLEIIRFLSDVILYIISNSIDFIDSTISIEQLVSNITDIATNNIIIGAIVGALYGAFEIASQLIIELNPDIDFEDIQLFPTDELQEILPEQLFDIALIRNIALIILMPLMTLAFVIYKFYMPVYHVNEQKRKIDMILPQSYLFLYSLTKGGLTITQAMEELANSKSTYTHVAEVFDDIVTQSKYGNMSLEAAINKQARQTQSTELEDFLQGLINVLDTGSDVSSYLANKTEQALKQEKKEQESYFNTLEMLSEAYIVTFVLAPIFIMVLQLVSAMTGDFNRPLTQMVPYVHVPAGGIIISLVIYILGSKYNNTNKISKPLLLYQVTNGLEHDETKKWNDYLDDIQKHSSLSLLFTLPVVFIYLSIMIQTGVIPLTIEEWNELPLQATIYGYYIPLLMVLIPWTFLYEKEKRRRNRVETQLPQLLNNIQESNKRGLNIDEAITTAAYSSDGNFYTELRKSLRKSELYGNLNYALIEFANKLETPKISQAVDLIARANSVSGDVSTVMKIIADDFTALYELKQERNRKAKAYVAIIFVSIMICTLVLVAIDVVFFGFVAEQASGGGEGDEAAPEISSFDSLPTGFFNRVLLHTVMMLSLVSGIVSGIMENNSPKNGFKYVIILTTVTIFIFALLEVLF